MSYKLQFSYYGVGHVTQLSCPSRLFIESLTVDIRFDYFGPFKHQLVFLSQRNCVCSNYALTLSFRFVWFICNVLHDSVALT